MWRGNFKRTLGGINKRPYINAERQNSDKVTNNSFNITQNVMILNKNENQQVLYYRRRHFVTCSLLEKEKIILTYLMGILDNEKILENENFDVVKELYL